MSLDSPNEPGNTHTAGGWRREENERGKGYKTEKKIVRENGCKAMSKKQEGNDPNPRQDVEPYRNKQANGGINLYLSPCTFISGGRQAGVRN